ncbi:unnamed protein product [Urochloa humidicola]
MAARSLSSFFHALIPVENSQNGFLIMSSLFKCSPGLDWWPGHSRRRSSAAGGGGAATSSSTGLQSQCPTCLLRDKIDGSRCRLGIGRMYEEFFNLFSMGI